jgi:hypothetical protein
VSYTRAGERLLVERDRVRNRAFVWGIVFGVLTTVALFPIRWLSSIDGERETWATTVIGWTYRVPWDQNVTIADWLPVVAALVAGIFVGLLVRSVVLFVNRP